MLVFIYLFLLLVLSWLSTSSLSPLFLLILYSLDLFDYHMQAMDQASEKGLILIDGSGPTYATATVRIHFLSWLFLMPVSIMGWETNNLINFMVLHTCVTFHLFFKVIFPHFPTVFGVCCWVFESPFGTLLYDEGAQGGEEDWFCWYFVLWAWWKDDEW